MRIDVLIPTYRRPDRIAGIVANIAATSDAPGVEVRAVFICDEDESLAAAREAGARAIRNVRAQSYSGAINTGARHSDAEWIFCAADDVTFRPGWVRAALPHMDIFDVIGTNDKHWGERNGEATHYFVRRSYAMQRGASRDGPGVVLHEGYRHYGTDTELIAVARARGVYVLELGSIVEHHPEGWGPEGLHKADADTGDAKTRANVADYKADTALFEARQKGAGTRGWLEAFRGYQHGATGVILTNGPSLMDLTEEGIAAVCGIRPVLAVKQAYHRAPVLTDWHIYNQIHYERYRHGPHTKVVTLNWTPREPLPGSHCHFEMCGPDIDNDSLILTRDWDRSRLDVQWRRQVGTGIMHELAIPLALWFGWSRAIVIGWDLHAAGVRDTEHGMPVPDEGLRCNKWEHAAHIETSAEYHAWCASQGLHIDLLSERTHLRMPRITYEEALPC